MDYTEKNEKFIMILVILLTGFFAGSDFLNHYIVTGTSFSFSELFLLPLMFLLRKEILYGTRQISSGGYFLLMFGLILWALLIAIGMVYDIYGSLRGVLGGARAYLYILLLAVSFDITRFHRYSILGILLWERLQGIWQLCSKLDTVEPSVR